MLKSLKGQPLSRSFPEAPEQRKLISIQISLFSGRICCVGKPVPVQSTINTCPLIKGLMHQRHENMYSWVQEKFCVVNLFLIGTLRQWAPAGRVVLGVFTKLGCGDGLAGCDQQDRQRYQKLPTE
jgi:hypothetical protein